MQFVAIIPARGRSKGIVGKNIAPCAGRPLIAWTCEAALSSSYIGRTIVSTDDERIADVARACGAEVPFRRPPELATETASSLDVMLHALEWCTGVGVEVRALVLLQPTSPLRTAEHIDAALAKYLAAEADTVVSVVAVPHRYHPDAVMTVSNGWLVGWRSRDRAGTRRQDLPTFFARNGPAILGVAPEVLRRRRLYGDRTLPFEMTHEDSVDIDTSADLDYADFLLRRREVDRRTGAAPAIVGH